MLQAYKPRNCCSTLAQGQMDQTRLLTLLLSDGVRRGGPQLNQILLPPLQEQILVLSILVRPAEANHSVSRLNRAKSQV